MMIFIDLMVEKNCV